MDRYLEDQAYEVSATDPVIIVLVFATVTIVAPAAAFLPALRATRISPVETLSETKGVFMLPPR